MTSTKAMILIILSLIILSLMILAPLIATSPFAVAVARFPLLFRLYP